MTSEVPAAILAAAGRGERSGAHSLKQFQTVGGRPLLQWSLDRLNELGCDPIVVVLPPDIEESRLQTAGELSGVRKVVGGATRQESVFNGLKLISRARVIVHDAARPFAPVELFSAALDALEHADAAVTGVPVDQTLKRVRDQRVLETVDRAALWSVQTPQAFRTATLLAAHERARAESFVGTDDAQLIERSGGTVMMVGGTRLNIKLTYPEDFALAERLARDAT